MTHGGKRGLNYWRPLALLAEAEAGINPERNILAATNLKIIDQSGIPYRGRNNALLFRQRGKPAVDFYYATGRWQAHIPGRQKLSGHGGAHAFLQWYSTL